MNGIGRIVQQARSPLGKAVRILEAISKETGATSLADVSKAARLPKPTAHRLIMELQRLCLIVRDPLTRRYRVGPALEELAVSTMRHGMAQSARRIHIERLAEKIGERINIGVLAAGKVVYVEWVESAGPFRIEIQAGAPVPIHCSANGKLLLAYAPASVRERILATTPFARHTPNTITTADQLRGELEAIRRHGYSEDNEEFLAGVCCLAVPVRHRRGEVAAGLAVMAPSARLPLAKAREYLPDLVGCADAIAQELGRRPRSRLPIPRTGQP